MCSSRCRNWGSRAPSGHLDLRGAQTDAPDGGCFRGTGRAGRRWRRGGHRFRLDAPLAENPERVRRCIPGPGGVSARKRPRAPGMVPGICRAKPAPVAPGLKPARKDHPGWIVGSRFLKLFEACCVLPIYAGERRLQCQNRKTCQRLTSPVRPS